MAISTASAALVNGRMNEGQFTHLSPVSNCDDSLQQQQQQHLTFSTSAGDALYQHSPSNYFHTSTGVVSDNVNFDYPPATALTYVPSNDAYADDEQQQQRYSDIHSSDSSGKGNTVIFDPSISYISSLDHTRDVNTLNSHHSSSHHHHVNHHHVNHHHHHHPLATTTTALHQQLINASSYNDAAHSNTNNNTLVTPASDRTHHQHHHHHHHLHHPTHHSSVSLTPHLQASRCNDLISNVTAYEVHQQQQNNRRTDSCTLSSCSSPSSSLTGISGDVHSSVPVNSGAHLSHDSIISQQQQQQQQSAPLVLHQVHHQHVDTTCDASTFNTSIDASISHHSTGGGGGGGGMSVCSPASSTSSSTVNCHLKPPQQQQQQLMHQAKVLHSALHQQMPIVSPPQAASQTLHQFNHSYPETSDC